MKKILFKNIMSLFIIWILIIGTVFQPASSLVFKDSNINRDRLQNYPVYFSETNWWNTDWQYRKMITINSSFIDDDLVNFPILFNVLSSDFISHTQDDGDDFVFIAADNSTKYNHEIEYFNSTLGQLIAWVNITDLSSSLDTVFYVYYGNPSSDNQENIDDTWNDGYVGVYHLNQYGTGTRYDSTSNGNDGSTNGYEGDEAIKNGRIGGADDFDGVNDNIEISDSASLDIRGDITISAWVKLDEIPGDKFKIFDKSIWSSPYNNSGYYIKVWDSNFDTSVLNNSPENLNNFTVSNELWYYVVSTWNGTHLKLYVDGTLQGSPVVTSISSIATNDYNARIASYTKGGYYWNGIIDEVRISSVARDDEWIDTSYEMVQNNDAFLSVGDEMELDVNPPEIIDNTPNVAYTGNEFTFNFTIMDESDLSEATVIYHYNENPSDNGELINTIGDYWEYSTIVEDTLGFIQYMVCVWDDFGNNNHTAMKNITIIDDELPEIDDVDVTPPVQTSDEQVNISAYVTDNVDVSDVGIYMVYPDSAEENFSIYDSQIENTYYSLRIYDQEGEYKFYVWAVDSYGNFNKSVELSFEIVLGDRPTDPLIGGEAQGKAGESYTYEFASTDSDGDEIFYYIDWGDGATEEWIGPYESGEIVKINHTWDEIGAYTIKAKARDTKGLESDWSQLIVKMPKIFNLFYSFVNWLIDCFPNLFSFLRILIFRII